MPVKMLLPTEPLSAEALQAFLDASEAKIKELERRNRTLKKLLTKWQELYEQFGMILAEQDNLLGGGVEISTKLHQLEASWQTAWASRYHGEYVFAYLRDRPQWKKLLKSFTVEALQIRILGYIRDGDPFYVQRRHPLNLFILNVNKYAPEDHFGTFDLESPVTTDCKHLPRCSSDAQHTKRRAAELRA